MTTLAQMADTVLAEVSSYVRSQDSITVLTQPCDADDLTLTVDDATALSKGLIEIGDELVYAKTIVKNSGVIQVLPGTRGYRGTTAAAHAAGELIRNNPTFPRAQVIRAINDTIKGIDLMVLSNHTLTFDGSTYAYELPAGVNDITGVSYDALDSTGVWPLIKNYRIDRNYDCPSGVAIIFHEAPEPGREVRIQYTSFPTPMASATSAFSETGLPASCEDVIRFGAMWRMVSTVDPGKVTATSVSADAMDAPVQAGRSSDVAKYIYQLFSVRLAEEKAKQSDNYLSVIQYQ